MIRELTQTSAQINKVINEVNNKNSDIGNCMADFTIMSELGKGSYGTVYKVQSNKDQNTYVLKKICLKHMKHKHQMAALKEVQILKTVNHPHIIKYYTSFMEEETMHIVMEFAEQGDLYKILKEQRQKRKYFTEKDLWDFALQICQAVEYLHAKNIIHRDIKCLNIFLTSEKNIKIGDLGVSKIVQSQMALHGTRVGTPLYLSPELVKQQPYDMKVDVWAIGCALYHLASLEPPFQGDNLITLGNNIVNKKPKPIPQIYSHKFMNFVDKLLSKRPQDRPSAREAVILIPTHVKNNQKESILKDFVQQQQSGGDFQQQAEVPKKADKKSPTKEAKKTPYQDPKNQERPRNHNLISKGNSEQEKISNFQLDKDQIPSQLINFYGMQTNEKKDSRNDVNRQENDIEVVLTRKSKESNANKIQSQRPSTEIPKEKNLQILKQSSGNDQYQGGIKDRVRVNQRLKVQESEEKERKQEEQKQVRDLRTPQNNRPDSQLVQRSSNLVEIENKVSFKAEPPIVKNPSLPKSPKEGQAKGPMYSQSNNFFASQSTNEETKQSQFRQRNIVQNKMESVLNKIEEERRPPKIQALIEREPQQSQGMNIHQNQSLPELEKLHQQNFQKNLDTKSSSTNLGSIELKRNSLIRPKTASMHKQFTQNQGVNQEQKKKMGVSLLRGLSQVNEDQSQLQEQAARPFSAVIPGSRKLGQISQKRVVAFQEEVKNDNSVSYIQIDDGDNEIDDNYFKKGEVVIKAAQNNRYQPFQPQQQNFNSQGMNNKLRPQTANLIFRNSSAKANVIRSSIEQNSNKESLVGSSQKDLKPAISSSVGGRQEKESSIKRVDTGRQSLADMENQFSKYYNQVQIRKTPLQGNPTSHINDKNLKEKIKRYTPNSVYSSQSKHQSDSKPTLVGQPSEEAEIVRSKGNLLNQQQMQRQKLSNSHKRVTIRDLMTQVSYPSTTNLQFSDGNN